MLVVNSIIRLHLLDEDTDMCIRPSGRSFLDAPAANHTIAKASTAAKPFLILVIGRWDELAGRPERKGDAVFELENVPRI